MTFAHWTSLVRSLAAVPARYVRQSIVLGLALAGSPLAVFAQTEIIRAPEAAWTSYAYPNADFTSGQEFCDAFGDYMAASGINYGPLTFALLVAPTDGTCLTSTQFRATYPVWALHCPDGFYQQNATTWEGTGYPHAHFRGDQSYCKRIGGGPDPAKNLGPCRDGTCGAGNPISVSPLVGNKYQSETDYVSDGVSTLRLQRSYNSVSLTNDEAPYRRDAANPWRFGRNWRSSYDLSLKLTATQYVSSVIARRGDGRVIGFTLMTGVWRPDSDIADRLVRLTDGSGNPTGWQYINAADDSVEAYDVDGKLISITTRSGIAQTLTYSDGSTPSSVAPRPGLLIGVTDSFGRQLAFTYDASNRVVTMTDPAGGAYGYAYGTNNNLTSVTYPDGTTRTYVYNESVNTSNTNQPNALTGIVDESNNRFATYKYNAQKRAFSTEHAGGAQKYTVSYSSVDSVVTDSLGKERTYTFQTILGVPRYRTLSDNCQGPGCGNVAKTLFYDVNGNVISRTQFNNNKTCHNFDLSRNLETSRLEGLTSATPCPADIAAYTPTAGTRQRKISTQWHSTFRVPTQIDEAGKRTTFTHDASGNVLTKTVLDTVTSESRTWTYTYNSFGQVLTANGPRTDVADVITYTYYNCATGYQCGHVETVTNAAGHVTTYNTYNAHGQPLTITDTNGVVTTFTYDLRQRLKTRTVGNEQTSFDYWSTGLLKKATLPDGSFLEYTYDAAHRLTDINDSEGNRSHYTLDAMGNRIAEETFDPSNALTTKRTRVFNTLNQLWKEIGAAGTANVTTTFGYDNNGNQTTVNAPLGRNSINAYDELNRLTQITDPASGLTKYGYNALDQLVSVTDPRNKVTSYTYNGLGDLKQQISPDTGTTTSTYDSAGNLATRTDARSKTATYGYDELNRVTSVTYADQTIGFTYDTGSNQKGRLTEITDSMGSTSWTYDPHGRVTNRTQNMGAVSKSVGYAYDLAGRLETLTLPSGNVISYGYTNGKITSLTLNGSTTILSDVLYHPFGPTTGWTWGNSTLAVREYDQDGNVSYVDSAGLRTYAYDHAFRITGVTDASDPNLSQFYGYDLLDRLTSATGTNLNQSWTYDANGNRLTQSGSAPSTYSVSSTSNRLSSVTGALTRSYGYDNAGNTTSDGSTTFTYNDAGRMVQAIKAGVTSTYAHNALGQRVRKTVAGSVTYFAYDEAGLLLGEYDGSGNPIQETVWLSGTPVATLRPNGGNVSVYYIHTDHLDTPRLVTQPSDNAIRWRWDRDPFGAAVGNDDPSGLGEFVYNVRFPGQYFDSDTGLHYNYYRDYDPRTGRYVESDPIGLKGGINTYAYVKGNPLNAIDQFGLATWSCIASNTGGVGYLNDGQLKVCRYTCSAKCYGKITFDASGWIGNFGSSHCHGVPVSAQPGPTGDLSENPAGPPDYFDVTTDGLGGLIDWFMYPSDLLDNLKRAEEAKPCCSN